VKVVISALILSRRAHKQCFYR